MSAIQKETVCSITGCEKSVKSLGWCSMHCARFYRHGDPYTHIHQRDRDLSTGKDHWNWTGDEVSYFAMHQRLRRLRGRASQMKCVDCDRAAQQWSYSRRGGDRQREGQWGPYSISIDDYEPRCIKCHKRHDLADNKGWGRHFDADKVAQEYLAGRGYKAIAKDLRVSKARIKAALISAGIEMRGAGGVPGVPNPKKDC